MKKVVGFVEKEDSKHDILFTTETLQGAPDTDEECSYDYVVGRCVQCATADYSQSWVIAR